MENSPESKSNTNKLRSFITSVSSQGIAHLLRCAIVCQSAVNHVPGLFCKGSTRSIPYTPFTLHPSPFTRLFLSRILEIRHLLELDVVELAVHLLHPPDIDGLDRVAGIRVDGDRPARAVELQALEHFHCLVAVEFAVQPAHHFIDRRHAIPAAHGHEVR